MTPQRGLVPPAIIISTTVMVVCAASWSALGVLSVDDPDALSIAMHRYLCMLLATVTTCSVMVNLFARLVRAIRVESTVDRYAAGYADGVEAAPDSVVSRLAPLRR